MRGFLALGWPPDDPVAIRTARALCARAEIEGWVGIEGGAASWVGVKGPNAPKAYCPRRGSLIIGEVYNRPDASPGPADDETDEAFAGWYSRNRWGRYVILFRDPDGTMRSVFRDPAGGLPAHAWRTGAVQVVASSTPDWLAALAPAAFGFDWDRIETLARAPFDLTGATPLTGLATVAPGSLHVLGGPSVQLWSPEAITARPAHAPAVAEAELRRTIDLCVAAMTDRKTTGIELSGGLDSAIVAGSVRASGRSIGFALNTRGEPPETDERRFALAVADKVEATLTCCLRQEVAFSADAFEATAGDPWPSQNGRDVSNDLTVAEACRSAGVETLLTGKGGDALFFQMHTPLAFADEFWRTPRRSLVSGQLPGVARWTRTSTWSLIRAARESRRSGASDLPPGKRMQIDAIASGLAYYSTCRRTDGIDIIHPLMAQPLVEWALRTPVPVLVPNGRERGLARDAFADRLPASVATRRGKGDYAAYFNQQAARNLPFLRDYLLDGRLAAQGVIDRPDLEGRLDEDVLRWQGGASEILALVSLEAWVRRWERRKAGV